MADEETKETPKIGTYEYAIGQGASEEQAREYVAREARRAARDNEPDDDGDEPDSEEVSSSGPTVRYFIHSGVRKRHTRLLRMKSPVHHDLVQRIGNLVVRRTRPVHVTIAKLRELLPELKKAQAEGRLELRTHDGRLVDLETGEALYRHPMPKPLPNPKLDSAADDLPAGEKLPYYPEGIPANMPAARPSVLPPDDDDEEEDEDTKSIPPVSPSSIPPPPAAPIVPPAPEAPPSMPPAATAGEKQEETTAPVETPAPETAPAADPEAEVTTNPSGETIDAEDETVDGEGETSEPSDETPTPESETSSKVPALPKVARGKRGGKR